MDKIKKINDKIEYTDCKVEAQGCSDDCIEYTNESSTYVKNQTVVGGGAIAMEGNCGTYIKCRTSVISTSYNWPLW